jgi:hypothetical protein
MSIENDNKCVQHICLNKDCQNTRNEYSSYCKDHNKDPIEVPYECIICGDLLLNGNEIRLSCYHWFHKNCLTQLQKFTCPFCRLKINIIDKNMIIKNFSSNFFTSSSSYSLDTNNIYNERKVIEIETEQKLKYAELKKYQDLENEIIQLKKKLTELKNTNNSHNQSIILDKLRQIKKDLEVQYNEISSINYQKYYIRFLLLVHFGICYSNPWFLSLSVLGCTIYNYFF